jgi:hypothetical protein
LWNLWLKQGMTTNFPPLLLQFLDPESETRDPGLVKSRIRDPETPAFGWHWGLRPASPVGQLLYLGCERELLLVSGTEVWGLASPVGQLLYTWTVRGNSCLWLALRSEGWPPQLASFSTWTVRGNSCLWLALRSEDWLPQLASFSTWTVRGNSCLWLALRSEVWPAR